MSEATSGDLGPAYRSAHAGYEFVIASEAKQSRGHEQYLDCFVARAPRNEDEAAVFTAPPPTTVPATSAAWHSLPATNGLRRGPCRHLARADPRAGHVQVTRARRRRVCRPRMRARCTDACDASDGLFA